MFKQRIVGSALPLSVLALTATMSSNASGATTKVVQIRNTDFHPHRSLLHRGDAVTWEFLDTDKMEFHNVTSTGRRRFRSSPDMLSGSFTVRFTRKGTYTYVCTIHFNMRGTVRVR